MTKRLARGLGLLLLCLIVVLEWWAVYHVDSQIFWLLVFGLPLLGAAVWLLRLILRLATDWYQKLP